MYNKIRTLVGVILVGAIGSLLYDILLKDFFFFLGSIFVKTGTFIYDGYVDYIYNEVGKGGYYFQIIPGIFITIFIISSPFLFYKKINDLYDKIEKTKIEDSKSILTYLSRKRQRMNLLIIITGIPIIILYTNMLLKEISTIKASRKIERDLDIIRPYVSDKKYHLFYSDYRQIDNKEKLINLLENIKTVAIENKVKLPESKLLGIEVLSVP